jgi:hypothetical protein
VFHHTQDAFNDIRRIRVSDGVELVQSLTPNGVNSIFEQADPPIPYSSDRCPILELRASAAEGGNPAFQGVIGPLVWWHMRRRVIQ